MDNLGTRSQKGSPALAQVFRMVSSFQGSQQNLVRISQPKCVLNVPYIILDLIALTVFGEQ
jgi:hypothetical protein